MNVNKKRTFSAVAIALVVFAVLLTSVASAAMSVQINPTSKTVEAGQTASFTALVYGNTGIPFYRWYINGVAQPQFTSSVVYITETDGGTYKIYVHVESASVKVDSREVTLTVKAAPTAAPTEAPTAAPTEEPTAAPTEAPTEAPTAAPTEVPTEAPTATPTTQPVLSLPNVAIYAIVAVIGIIVIVAAVLVLFRKKK